MTRSVVSTAVTEPSPRGRRRRVPAEGTSYDQRFHMVIITYNILVYYTAGVCLGIRFKTYNEEVIKSTPLERVFLSQCPQV